MKKNVLSTHFCLIIEGEPVKANVGETLLNDVGADHLNMDIQMEEANLYPGDVQEPLDDAVLGPHDAVIGPVHGVQQKPRKLSYSNIVFITALHFNKLKITFGI